MLQIWFLANNGRLAFVIVCFFIILFVAFMKDQKARKKAKR